MCDEQVPTSGQCLVGKATSLTEAGGARRPQALENFQGLSLWLTSEERVSSPGISPFLLGPCLFQGLSGEHADGTVGGWGKVQR